jgi:hypothetical protein
MAYGTPDRLYTSSDLFDGYDPDDSMAFTKSWDFQTYRTYVADGGTTPKTLDIRRAQADHDAMLRTRSRFSLTVNRSPNWWASWAVIVSNEATRPIEPSPGSADI